MSDTATQRQSQSSSSTGVHLEEKYKPVGISAVNAAALCKGTAKKDKSDK